MTTADWDGQIRATELLLNSVIDSAHFALAIKMDVSDLETYKSSNFTIWILVAPEPPKNNNNHNTISVPKNKFPTYKW